MHPYAQTSSSWEYVNCVPRFFDCRGEQHCGYKLCVRLKLQPYLVQVLCDLLVLERVLRFLRRFFLSSSVPIPLAPSAIPVPTLRLRLVQGDVPDIVESKSSLVLNERQRIHSYIVRERPRPSTADTLQTVPIPARGLSIIQPEQCGIMLTMS